MTAGVVVLLAMTNNLADAAGLERLFMPGRVIEGHADVEDDCGACHDASSDKASASLCASCHEDVAADRKAQSGFHGRFPASQENECVTCHTDHEGRDADIVALNSGLFDHRWTDFSLTGAHLSAECSSCHASEDEFRDAPTLCGSCHQDADVHEGGLGRSCGSCHGSANWSDVSFDHAATGYALNGGHMRVACVDCHRDNNYDATPKRCSACHAIDDTHRGSKGNACQDCHSTASWRGIRFDHVTTGFPLTNGHDGLQCNDCHRREDHTDRFDGGCTDCHSMDDDHQGRNGSACETCHQTTTWADTIFDHAETGFALLDAHSSLNCVACHKDSSMALVPATCGECHSVDDSHSGQLGVQCAQCHTQTAWHTRLRFDHDLTSFPLNGLHATVACGECHTSNRFHDAAEDCASCHRDDDPHEGALGENCGMCHNSNAWSTTTFDHDVHTSFSLIGAHENLNCNDCHRDASGGAADVPSTCGGCHASDDIHQGQFGSDCAQCHSLSSFEDVESLSGRSP